MDNTILMYIGGALIALMMFKFIIRLPMLLFSLAVLSALGYAVYRFVWPMLQGMI